MALGALRHLQSAKHIVAHRLPGIAHFHQRHMLVSRRVEHQGWLPLGKDLIKTLRILHVTRQRDNGDVGLMVGEPLLNGIEHKLAGFDQHQPRRRKLGQLPTQLAADGAARAGHQHRLAGDHCLHMVSIDRHRLSPQQVFDFDGAHRIDRHLAAHQVFETRYGKGMRAGAHRQISRTPQSISGS